MDARLLQSGFAYEPESASRRFAEFARHAHAAAPRKRLFGLAGVAAIHGAVLAAYFFLGGRFASPEPQHSVQVVTLQPETMKPPPPPPTPQFLPPQTYVAAPIVPEVIVDVPPSPKAITVPPPPVAAAAQAPLADAQPKEAALGADARGAYLARLLTHLNMHKRYPEGARRRRQEGVVSLRFTMDRQGRVLSYSVAKSSGTRMLDDEARALIERAQPLPPIPAGFGKDQLDLVVPIEFFLH